MYDTPQDLIAALRSTPSILSRLLRSARETAGSPGWSAVEIVCHLRDSEITISAHSIHIVSHDLVHTAQLIQRLEWE